MLFVQFLQHLSKHLKGVSVKIHLCITAQIYLGDRNKTSPERLQVITLEH